MHLHFIVYLAEERYDRGLVKGKWGVWPIGDIDLSLIYLTNDDFTLALRGFSVVSSLFEYLIDHTH